MPRLPIIQAEEALPRRIPYGGLDTDTMTLRSRALQRGAETLGATAAKIGNQAQSLLDKEREAEDTIEAMQLRTRFGQELTDLDGKLRSEPDFDLKTHSEKLNEKGNELLDRLGSEAKRPEVARMLKLHGSQSLSTQVVNTKYEYRKNLSGKADAAHVALQRQAESEATQAIKSGDPQFGAILMTAFDRASDALANQGHITPEQAGERKLSMRENVDTTIARDVIRNNPYEAAAALQDPAMFPNLRQARRDSLIVSAAHGVTAAESAERRKRGESEHQAKAKVNALGLDVLKSWDPSTPPNKRMTRDQVEAALEDPEIRGIITLDQVTSIRKVMNSDLVAGGQDMPGVSAQTALGIAMKDPKVTRESIYNQVTRGQLSAATAAKLIDDFEKETSEKGVASKEEFKQASAYLTRAITGVDPMASLLGGGIGAFLNGDAKLKYAAAHERLYREARRINERPKPGESLLDLIDIAKRIAGEDKAGGGAFNPLAPPQTAPPAGQQQKPAAPSSRESRDTKRGFDR